MISMVGSTENARHENGARYCRAEKRGKDAIKPPKKLFRVLVSLIFKNHKTFQCTPSHWIWICPLIGKPPTGRITPITQLLDYDSSHVSCEIVY